MAEEPNIDLIKSSVSSMIRQGAPEADIDAYLNIKGVTPLDLRHGGKVDTESGASWKARALVGLYDKPEDRLRVMQQLYPDAKPEGEDNFVFTSPSTGKKTIFNPKGLDWGDIPGVIREVATGVGGTLGAIGGTVGATPGLGTIAGAGAGAAATGMGVDKVADWLTGTERPYLDKLKNVGVDFAANAAGEGIGAGINKLIGPQVSRLTGMAGDQLTALAERLGIPLPTRGTAYQNRGLQSLEQAVGNTFGGAQIMENAHQKTLTALRQAIDEHAGTLGAIHPDAESLGTAALQAAQSSTERMRQEAQRRFNAVYQGIDDRAVSGLENTQGFLNQAMAGISDPAERARFLGDPTIQRALNLATSPSLDVQTLRNAITDMAQKARLGGSAIDTSTASQAQLTGLLSALKSDRDAVVSGLGRGAELADSNKWYANEKALREGLESVFGKEFKPVDLDLLATGVSGAQEPLKAAEVGAKLLNPALPNNMQRALQSALGGDYGSIAATRLARMADPTAGASGAGVELASPGTLLTNFNKSAKSGGEAVKPSEWDNLMAIAAALKDAEKMANFSGTARATAGMSLLQGLGAGALGTVGYQDSGTPGGLMGAAGGIAAPAAVALMLANPRLATSPGAMRAVGLAPGFLSRMALEPVGDWGRK